MAKQNKAGGTTHEHALFHPESQHRHSSQNKTGMKIQRKTHAGVKNQSSFVFV